MQDFMKDRYGVDDLTVTLGLAGAILAIAGSFTDVRPLSWLAIAVMVVAIVRALSKNRAARERENAAYLGFVRKIPFIGERVGTGRASSAAGSGAGRASGEDLKRQARTAKKMWKERKTKSFLKCPQCGTVLAVPKGKGKMIVTCPKCKARMETKS